MFNKNTVNYSYERGLQLNGWKCHVIVWQNKKLLDSKVVQYGFDCHIKENYLLQPQQLTLDFINRNDVISQEGYSGKNFISE